MTNPSYREQFLQPQLTDGPLLLDRWLLFSIIGLMSVGLLMVTSASIVIAERQYQAPFYYVFRQLVFLGGGGLLAIAVLRLPVIFWYRVSGYLLLFAILLLVVVFLPGLSRTVNGSSRWLHFAGFNFQASEFAKLAMILYLAGYIKRRNRELRTQLIGFLKPMALLGGVGVLLLLEPDFGATVVIITTAMVMMFLAGVPLRYFIALAVLVGIGMAALAISSPYRLERLTSFLNPWATQFDSGYQLTQSLIAFGRGGIFGVGLGESIQKLFYLPEAHTDFIFAVIAEEFGLMGEGIVIGLFTLFFVRVLFISRRAYLQQQLYSAYTGYGIGMWFAMQMLINVGVSAGVLPTKGLTLPFISYGGSSLMIACVAVAIVLRIDYEVRVREYR